MRLISKPSIWTDKKVWFISAVGAAVAITGGLIARKKMNSGKKTGSAKTQAKSPGWGTVLLGWFGKAKTEDPASGKITENEPVPEPVKVTKIA